MKNLLKELYYMVSENLTTDFLCDPSYLRCEKESAQLEDELIRALGESGFARWNDYRNAESAEAEFWDFAKFRAALALGIQLGRLTA